MVIRLCEIEREVFQEDLEQGKGGIIGEKII